MAVIKTSISNVESNFAKFDLALICEAKYEKLKHIDMVVYTMLKNQETLSINSVKNGNKRYVDSNGYVFVSISQNKLCKILKTTKPTLAASFKRLEECELIENVKMGPMECNRIYVGSAESTTTLGEYVTKIGIELDEEIEEKVPTIKVTNINKKADTQPQVSTTNNKNRSSNKIINQNSKNYNPKNKNGIKLAKSKVKVGDNIVDPNSLDNETIEKLSKDKWNW